MEVGPAGVAPQADRPAPEPDARSSRCRRACNRPSPASRARPRRREALHGVRCRHKPTWEPLRRPRSTFEPKSPQRPVQHPRMAAPECASASGVAWSAWELVPGLRARRPSRQRPDCRSRRAARSRWRTPRYRQLRGALPVVQLDQGSIRARPGVPTRRFRAPGRPRPPFVCKRPGFANNPCFPRRSPTRATGAPTCAHDRECGH